MYQNKRRKGKRYESEEIQDNPKLRVAKKKKSGVTTPIYLPPTTKNVLRVKRLVPMVSPTDMPTMTLAVAAIRHHCGR
jgi:hypothetical protein